jgi:hypothetical protein
VLVFGVIGSLLLALTVWIWRFLRTPAGAR